MTAGIQLIQNGVTFNAAGVAHPAPITLVGDILCYLTFVGSPVPVNYEWSQTTSAGSSSVLSSASSPGPTFTPGDGWIGSVSLEDENGNTYVLDVTSPTVSTQVGMVYPETYGAEGDGVVDDTTPLQTAINALEPGGALSLRNGATYRITSQLSYIGSSGSKDNTKIYGNGATIHCDRNVKFMALYWVTGFELTGLTVTGTLQTDGGDPTGSPTNISQGVLEIGGADPTFTADINVHGNTWSDIGGYAIWPAGNTANVNIHHNNFIRTQAGVQTISSAEFNYDLSINDNYFLGNVWAAASTNKTVGSDDMIAVFNGDGRVSICRNVIDKQGLIGRDGTANDASTNQARAIDINIDNLASTTELIINENIISNCISTSTTYGRPAIEIFGDPTNTKVIKSMSISGNIIKKSNQAMAVDGPVFNCVINNNVIVDVTVLVGHAEANTEGDGIAVFSHGNDNTGITISGNSITGVAGIGIFCDSTNRSSIIGNAINAVTGRGIQITSADDLTISGNVVNTSADYALVMSGYTRAVVSGNSLKGAAKDVSLQGSSNSGLFIGNVFKSSTGSQIDDATSASTNRFVANDDYLVNTATWNPASINVGASEITTVTVTNAALGDGAEASFSLDIAGLTLTAYVSSADTVTACLANNTAGAVNLGSGTLKVWVTKR